MALVPRGPTRRPDTTLNTQPPEWPGERNPSQWDVHDAYQVPEVSFLKRYKAALLLSQDGAGCRQYLSQKTILSDPTGTSPDVQDSNAIRQYTYPMVILSDLPLLPDNDHLTQLQDQFFNSFKYHVFLDPMAIAECSSGRLIPPYLEIALACLGTMGSRRHWNGFVAQSQASADPHSQASDLCLSGTRLWGVMMEVDNREARFVESILAGALFATYGMLTANSDFWDLSSSTIAGTTTMARRLKMHYADTPTFADRTLFDTNAKTSSLLMSYLFLTDVVRAAHHGTIPCISTSELFMRLPASPYRFNTIYSSLISGSGALPVDLKTDEDSLLLLVGICSDILYVHHAFSSITYSENEAKSQSCGIRNPYASLTPESEALRHRYSLDAALTRWFQHFRRVAKKDTLSLFYFCRLLLGVPKLLLLPHLVGYPPSETVHSSDACPRANEVMISDEAINFAWLLLDNSNAQSGVLNTNISVWLPVVLFYAALTVWCQLQQQTSSSNLKTGTLKTLGMFKNELKHLPWPCCAEMCTILDKLMNR